MKTLTLIPLVILMIVSCNRESPDQPEVKQELSLRSDGEVIAFDELTSADYLFFKSGDVKSILFRFDESDALRLNEFTSKHVGSQITVHINSHQLWKAELASSLTSSLEVQLDSKLEPDMEHSISIIINGDIGRIELPDEDYKAHDNAHDAVESMLKGVFK